MATKKPATDAEPIDVTKYGFRLPAPRPASGDATFDDALAQLLKKCEGAFKKGQSDVTLPARLAKPKPGDDERIRAQLDPEIDLGAYEYDLARIEKEYLAAWRVARGQGIPREIYLAALAKLALATDAGEPAVRALVAVAVSRPTFADVLIEAVLASPRKASDETLAVAARALDTEGEPRELYRCWHAAARAAIALGAERAAALLAPHLGTTRARAVGDALGKAPADIAAAVTARPAG